MKGGTPHHRPTASLLAERERIASGYRDLVASDDDEKAAFGQLLGLAEAGDVFHLHRTEIDQALADLSLAWAAGSPPLGGASLAAGHRLAEEDALRSA